VTDDSPLPVVPPPSTVDEIPWDDPAGPPPERLATAKPKPCRHPKGRRIPAADGGWSCPCGHVVTGDAVRRARRAIRRGKDAERTLARESGQRRVGHLGGPVDVGDATSPIAWQSKAGPTYWPTRTAAYLDALAPAAHGRPRAVVYRETGHHGRRNRAIVCLYLDELDDALLAGLGSLDAPEAGPDTGAVG
jgi:hypothetical protein